jgi:hypothetical protein
VYSLCDSILHLDSTRHQRTSWGREFERKSIPTSRFGANNDAGMADDALKLWA